MVIAKNVSFVTCYSDPCFVALVPFTIVPSSFSSCMENQPCRLNICFQCLGVSWADMHCLANRVQLEGLRDIGLLQGDINEMMKLHVGAVFMPYGLGHLMGLDVHDVGGYPKVCQGRWLKRYLSSLDVVVVVVFFFILACVPLSFDECITRLHLN